MQGSGSIDLRRVRGAAIAFGATLALSAWTPLPAEVPFATEEAETLENGLYSIDMGALFRLDATEFGVVDRDYQIDVPTARISFGVGKHAELQASGSVIRFSEIGNEENTNSGDWSLATKIWFLAEKERRPSLSFLYQVKLPNGSDERGGATDETDFFGFVILSQGITRRDIVHVNLGLGILGNPFDTSAQNDVGIYRVAWERRISTKQLFGVEATVQSGPRPDDDPRFLRVVYSRRFGRWSWNSAMGAGFGDDADSFVLESGVRRRFFLYSPGGTPRRNLW